MATSSNETVGLETEVLEGTPELPNDVQRRRVPNRPRRAREPPLAVVMEGRAYPSMSPALNRSIAARSRSTFASSAAVIQAALSSRLYPHGQALSRPQRRPGHPVGPIGDHLDLGEAVKQRREDNLALHPG
jgi:hypothetical protein